MDEPIGQVQALIIDFNNLGSYNKGNFPGYMNLICEPLFVNQKCWLGLLFSLVKMRGSNVVALPGTDCDTSRTLKQRAFFFCSSLFNSNLLDDGVARIAR